MTSGAWTRQSGTATGSCSPTNASTLASTLAAATTSARRGARTIHGAPAASVPCATTKSRPVFSSASLAASSTNP